MSVTNAFAVIGLLFVLICIPLTPAFITDKRGSAQELLWQYSRVTWGILILFFVAWPLLRLLNYTLIKLGFNFSIGDNPY